MCLPPPPGSSQKCHNVVPRCDVTAPGAGHYSSASIYYCIQYTSFGSVKKISLLQLAFYTELFIFGTIMAFGTLLYPLNNGDFCHDQAECVVWSLSCAFPEEAKWE